MLGPPAHWSFDELHTYPLGRIAGAVKRSGEKRKQYSGQFKFKVALEAAKGTKMIATDHGCDCHRYDKRHARCYINIQQNETLLTNCLASCDPGQKAR